MASAEEKLHSKFLGDLACGARVGGEPRSTRLAITHAAGSGGAARQPDEAACIGALELKMPLRGGMVSLNMYQRHAYVGCGSA